MSDTMRASSHAARSNVWFELQNSMAAIGNQLNACTVTLVSKRGERDVLSHTAWHRETSPEQRIQHAAIGRIVEKLPSHMGRDWTIEVERDADLFSEQETLLARQFLQLFKNSFAIWARLQFKRRRLSAFEGLINTASHAVIIVNPVSHILFANAKADTLLNSGETLVRADGRLTASNYSDAMRVQAALQFALSRDFGKGHTNVVAPLLKVSRTEGRPLFIAILPIKTLEPIVGEKMAAIYVVDPAVDLLEPVKHICRLHGLTQTETRLASHIANGHSITDAAALMMIKPQTARAYLKHIFHKLGITRQADLVRILVTNIIPLRAEFVSVNH